MTSFCSHKDANVLGWKDSHTESSIPNIQMHPPNLLSINLLSVPNAKLVAKENGFVHECLFGAACKWHRQLLTVF